MSLSKTTIEKIEKFSRIRVKSNSDFIYDLSRVNREVFDIYLGDLDGFKPLQHSSDIYARLRKDEAEQSLTQEEALMNAGQTVDNHFTCLSPFPKPKDEKKKTKRNSRTKHRRAP